MSEYGLRHAECIWVERLVVDEGHQEDLGDHTHPYAQLAWAARGELTVSIDGRRWVLSPSQAIWIPADHPHDARALSGSELYSVHVWEEECELGWSGLTVLAMDPLARELVRHLSGEGLEDQHARFARATLLGALRPARAAGLDLPLPTDARARRLAHELLAHPADPRTLREWAHQLHTSSKTLQRAFITETGMTYSQWRTQARLYRSLPLLAAQVPVSRAAAQVGYASPNGFVGAFRRHFGTTPAGYFSR